MFFDTELVTLPPAASIRSVDGMLEADPEKIAEAPGIGPISAQTISETLSEERFRALIERLREHGLQFVEEGPLPGEGGPLEGQTFVLTGTLPNLSREKATEEIEAAGGKVTSSVSKKTDYLVAGAEPGSKLAKAEQLGTEIIDEDRLRELLPS